MIHKVHSIETCCLDLTSRYVGLMVSRRASRAADYCPTVLIHCWDNSRMVKLLGTKSLFIIGIMRNAFFAYSTQFIDIKADGDIGTTVILKFKTVFDLQRLRKTKIFLIWDSRHICRVMKPVHAKWKPDSILTWLAQQVSIKGRHTYTDTVRIGVVVKRITLIETIHCSNPECFLLCPHLCEVVPKYYLKIYYGRFVCIQRHNSEWFST